MMEEARRSAANHYCVMKTAGDQTTITLETNDPAETRALARNMGRRLRPGDFVALIGPLGAGKTAFVQGLAEALAVEGQVTSPTFVLMRLHRGDTPLCHVDAYRLEGAGDLMDIGLEDWLSEAVVALEWADTVPAALPPERIEIRIAYAPAGRTIQMRGLGRRGAEIVERMAENDSGN